MPPAVLPKGFKRLLVVCPNWLGDVLFATPLLRAIKKAYPDSQVDVLLPERVRDVLKNNPNIHRVIVYNERIHVGTLPQTLWLAATLRAERYETAILLTPSASKTRLLRLSGIPVLAGYDSDKRSDLTHAVTPPTDPIHKIDHFLKLGASLGIDPDGRDMDFFPEPSACDSLAMKLKRIGKAPSTPYAVLHVGGNWHLKRWPLKRFAEWAERWLEKKEGVLIVCGTSSENALAQQLSNILGSPRLFSLCGQTSLHELGWLLKGAQLVLSNDSGPVHLAATQKTPIIALFGPTSASLTGPHSSGSLFVFQSKVGCAVPCYFQSCNDHLCMESIDPQNVFEKALELVP